MRRTQQASTARLLGLMLAAIALLAFIVPAPASAQAVSGTILGVVKDSSGGVVPGATVTLVNTEHRLHPLGGERHQGRVLGARSCPPAPTRSARR